MPTPTFTPPPTAPARTDPPATFRVRATAFVAWFATLYAELVAFVVWVVDSVASVAADSSTAEAAAAAAEAAAALAVTGADYMATSNSTVALSAGAGKTVVLNESGKDFIVDDFIVGKSRSNPENWFYAQVTGVAGQTLTATIPADGFGGSGSPDDWIIELAAIGNPGASKAAMLAGVSAFEPITPLSIYEALGDEVTLTDGTTISLDMSTFINAKVTLGGNRTLANPTNPKPGQTGRIRVIQDGTGGRTLSFGSNWKRQGGAPALTATAGAEDYIEYDVISSTKILYDVIRNPS